MLCWRRASCA